MAAALLSSLRTEKFLHKCDVLLLMSALCSASFPLVPLAAAVIVSSPLVFLSYTFSCLRIRVETTETQNCLGGSSFELADWLVEHDWVNMIVQLLSQLSAVSHRFKCRHLSLLCFFFCFCFLVPYLAASVL